MTVEHPADTPAVEANGVGRRFGKFWALRECTLQLPAGSITAVVGPNGAGKTTLLNLLVGLLPPSEGDVRVLARTPSNDPRFLATIGFVAQDCPLYKEFSAADLLRLGRELNPRWDEAIARERLAGAGVPLDRRAGKLSGGQRAQVALALAVAKRPDLLVLDEPLASLDPLARREFLQSLMATASSTGATVVLSSHLIGELARVCDHLIVIAAGQVRLAGDLDQILDEHRWVSGSPSDTDRLPQGVDVIAETRHERHTRLLAHVEGPLLNPALTVESVGLEDLVLAYLERTHDRAERTAPLPAGHR
jgi:ABC-2 type transport system ATP-binding protein